MKYHSFAIIFCSYFYEKVFVEIAKLPIELTVNLIVDKMLTIDHANSDTFSFLGIPVFIPIHCKPFVGKGFIASNYSPEQTVQWSNNDFSCLDFFSKFYFFDTKAGVA